MLAKNEEGVCELCGGRILSVDYELVCSACGAVQGVEEQSIHSVYDFNSIDLLDELRLGSYVGSRYEDKELAGNISSSGSNLYYIKKTSDFNQLGKSYRTLEYVSKMIDACCGMLNMPKRIANMAKLLCYRMLNRSGYKRGTLPAIAGFSIIASCRSCGIAMPWRSVKESLKLLGHQVRLRHLIDISINEKDKLIIAPDRYLNILAGRLLDEQRIKDRITEMRLTYRNYHKSLLLQAKIILQALDKNKVQGYNPQLVAATCLFLAENILAKKEKRRRVFSQTEFSEITKVSKFTLREQAVKFRRVIREKFFGKSWEDELYKMSLIAHNNSGWSGHK